MEISESMIPTQGDVAPESCSGQHRRKTSMLETRIMATITRDMVVKSLASVVQHKPIKSAGYNDFLSNNGLTKMQLSFFERMLKALSFPSPF